MRKQTYNSDNFCHKCGKLLTVSDNIKEFRHNEMLQFRIHVECPKPKKIKPFNYRDHVKITQPKYCCELGEICDKCESLLDNKLKQ